MPGMTLRYDCITDFRGDASEYVRVDSVRRALGQAAVLPHHAPTFSYATERFVAGANTYDGYPTHAFTVDDACILFEGRIYAEDAAATVARAVELIVADDTAGLTDWVTSTDGEFVVAVYEGNRSRLTVINDVFGRLPVYWTFQDGTLVVSRDIGVVRALQSTVDVHAARFDELGIAQSLLFGFPLGTRTLYDGIEKLPPATLLSLDGDAATSQTLHQFDFERLAARGKRADADLDELVEQFDDACRARASGGGPTVLSLSGGHDSRAVAAGLARTDCEFRSATFRRADGYGQRDVDVAETVARQLDVQWDRFDLAPTTEADRETLLSLKSGMNHLGMAFILAFLSELRTTHGPQFTYVTGDGGDKALPDQSPPKSLTTVGAVADYILARDSLVFSASEVADLLDVPEARLRETLCTHLASYPESDPTQVYKHFKITQRGFNWLFEGEDRNRAYGWSTSPFYSVPFFETAMSFADDEKTDNRLYRSFMRELWAAGVDIPDANYGVPMGSPLYTATMLARGFLARNPGIEDLVRTAYRGEVGYEYDTGLATRLRRQIDADVGLEDVFDTDRLAAIAADRSSCNRQQAVNLLTMTSVVAAIDRAAAGELRVPQPA